MFFHRRLGHLHYDSIIKMAADSASGILHINKVRDKCLACAKRKHTKNRQSSEDTGNSSPIDVIG